METVGKDFDVQVKEWRDSILPLLSSSNVIVSDFMYVLYVIVITT